MLSLGSSAASRLLSLELEQNRRSSREPCGVETLDPSAVGRPGRHIRTRRSKRVRPTRHTPTEGLREVPLQLQPLRMRSASLLGSEQPPGDLPRDSPTTRHLVHRWRRRRPDRPNQRSDRSSVSACHSFGRLSAERHSRGAGGSETAEVGSPTESDPRGSNSSAARRVRSESAQRDPRATDYRRSSIASPKLCQHPKRWISSA
jgi:hypothetical protein